jgi:hypothetical protein
LVDEQMLSSFELSLHDAQGSLDSIRSEGQRQVDEANALIEQAEREAVVAEDRLARVKRDYQDGKLEAEDWTEQRAELEGERIAAKAEAEQYREQAETLARNLEALDADAELQRSLTEIREAVEGKIEKAEGIDALRAALAQTFEVVYLYKSPERLTLVPYLRAEAVRLGTEAYAKEIPLTITSRELEPTVPSPPGRRGPRARRSRTPERRVAGAPRPRRGAPRGRRERA